jgi:hypothetical protein
MEIDKRPKAVSELRMRLKERRGSNAVYESSSKNLPDTSSKNDDSDQCCKVALPRECNIATDLITEFVKVDKVSEPQARAMAAVSIVPRPSAEWLAMLDELDTLIDRYCSAASVPQANKDQFLKARANQAWVNVPATLNWFRKQVAALESGAEG